MPMEDKLFRYGVFTKSRVEAFSDGIFAIVVTLLVLELKVPELHGVNSSAELFNALLALVPKFIGWVISFLTVCIVWVNHHRIFELFKGINIVLFWLNVNMLLWISFVPFPTALIGDYPHNPLAVASYGIVMFFTCLAFVSARIYGLRHPGLLKETVAMESYKENIKFAVIFGPVLYLVSAALAWVHTYISFLLYFLITAYFAFSFAIHTRQKESKLELHGN